MMEPDLPMVLFDAGLNGTPGMSNVDPPTLAEVGAYARCFEAKVILDWPKESGLLPRRKAYRFDIMCRCYPANAIAGRSYKEQDEHRSRILSRLSSLIGGFRARNIYQCIRSAGIHITCQIPWLQMAQCTRMDNTECLFAGWCYDLALRQRSVRVGLLHTECYKEPAGLLYIIMSTKGRWSSNLSPWWTRILGRILLRWLKSF
jgi:hypothetical protein